MNELWCWFSGVRPFGVNVRGPSKKSQIPDGCPFPVDFRKNKRKTPKVSFGFRELLTRQVWIELVDGDWLLPGHGVSAYRRTASLKRREKLN
jgi:hypothetical protein